MNATFFTFTENVIGELDGLGHTGTAKNYRATLNSFKRYKRNRRYADGSLYPIQHSSSEGPQGPHQRCEVPLIGVADARLRGLRSPLDGDRKLLGRHPAIGLSKRSQDNKDIPIEAIDHILIEDYCEYLKSTGLVPNSISFYMRILRAIYNRAVDIGLTKDRRPFRKVFTGMEKTLKRSIPIKEIRSIKKLDLSKKPHLEFARDLFLFLFLCRGMSFIDAAYLKKTDIRNGVLTYRRHKTGQTLHIEIIRPILELIERYSYKTADSPYLLPIITTPDHNERRQYESALHNVNKSLKTIGEMVSLPIRLTTYVSRHSWATIAKSKNIPINVISDALGHDSIATTQIYLASIDQSVINRANRLIAREL